MEKSDSNIGLFFCSHSRPNSSEGSAKESRRAGTAEYVTKDHRRKARAARTLPIQISESKNQKSKVFLEIKKKVISLPQINPPIANQQNDKHFKTLIYNETPFTNRFAISLISWLQNYYYFTKFYYKQRKNELPHH